MRQLRSLPETPVHLLRRTVQDLHRCTALFVGSAHVAVAAPGLAPWEGLVSTFDLAGHPNAERAYAWSSETASGAARCYEAVLHAGAVDSPRAAVLASLRAASGAPSA